MRNYSYPELRLGPWKNEEMDLARWVWDNVEKFVSRKHMEELTDRTIEKLLKLTIAKRAFFGWSGGKDSFVVADLCSRAGINNGQQVLCQPSLEFPALEKFYNENRPPGVWVSRTNQDINWLIDVECIRNPNGILFADDSASSRLWLAPKWKAHKTFLIRRGAEAFVVGRRKIDGNMVGKDGLQYSNETGILTINIIYDWSHEEVFAYYKRAGYPEPPYIRWKRGFQFGNEPWGHRHYAGSKEDNWRVILGIEPGLKKYKNMLKKAIKKS